jgi:hypothetical protein
MPIIEKKGGENQRTRGRRVERRKDFLDEVAVGAESDRKT